MIRHVLVAVDDSPAGLAALRLALDLACGWEAKVRAVTVVADHTLAERLRFALRDDDGRGATAGTGRGGLAASGSSAGQVDVVRGGNDVQRRRVHAAEALLSHVAGLAERGNVPVETALRAGDPAARVLEEAAAWPADLIVLGRSDRSDAGQPYVGSHTRQVLEFAEQPVLVVPASGAGGNRVT